MKRERDETTTTLHKLLYFDFPGKAEAIRLALTHAGVSFEDHRFADRAEFQALKASGRLQFGQVPALEVTSAAAEVTVLTQSAAILRYVAKLNPAVGLYPTDPLLAARVDAVCDLARYANVYAKITFMHAASREPYPHRDTHHLVHQLIAAFGAERWWTRPLADDSSRLARSHTMIAVLLACGARISPGRTRHSLATRTPRPSRYSGSTWGCWRRTGAG